jgi:hypothetical protein
MSPQKSVASAAPAVAALHKRTPTAMSRTREKRSASALKMGLASR